MSGLRSRLRSRSRSVKKTSSPTSTTPTSSNHRSRSRSTSRKRLPTSSSKKRKSGGTNASPKKKSSSDELYAVKRVLDKRIGKNGVEYLTDWFPIGNKTFEPTWELETNFIDRILIDAYEAELLKNNKNKHQNDQHQKHQPRKSSNSAAAKSTQEEEQDEDEKGVSHTISRPIRRKSDARRIDPAESSESSSSDKYTKSKSNSSSSSTSLLVRLCSGVMYALSIWNVYSLVVDPSTQSLFTDTFYIFIQRPFVSRDPSLSGQIWWNTHPYLLLRLARFLIPIAFVVANMLGSVSGTSGIATVSKKNKSVKTPEQSARIHAFLYTLFVIGWLLPSCATAHSQLLSKLLPASSPMFLQWLLFIGVIALDLSLLDSLIHLGWGLGGKPHSSIVSLILLIGTCVVDTGIIDYDRWLWSGLFLIQTIPTLIHIIRHGTPF
jgi:hypothetical protein